MRDADLEVAHLTAQVGVLEQQLAAAKRRCDLGGLAEEKARLGRVYGATRGLRTGALRQLEDGGDVGVAVAFLRAAERLDAEWDATRRS